MYFRLNPECYFIKGRNNGAIFDLIEGKTYSLNSEETGILSLCENNLPITQDYELLFQLKDLCLGNFYKEKPYIQKIKIDPSNDDEYQNLEFYRAYLEINNSCNKDCNFCGSPTKRSLGCLGCNKWDGKEVSLDIERWKEIIDELVNLGCQEIYIKGGDLTLDWAKTLEILDYVNGKFLNIQITLNEYNISKDIIQDIDNRANLIIQIEDIKHIGTFENATYILIVYDSDPLKYENLDNENVLKDYIIEKSRINNVLPAISKKTFPHFDLKQFLNNIEYHPCLGHIITISYDGKVLICPMMRSNVIGDLKSNNLHEIFKEEYERIKKFWKCTLDNIEKCTECEFRYACMDCRALEEVLTENFNKKALCDYNPISGERL
ncbi:hypothetical protein JCM15415_11060 [Methanobacterium movens]|jgi:radical SAM protein with 4Fe4S-binding SPASM domain|nr:MAG: hypothetical protein CIT03_01140 [Methanobacterium sp.]